MKNIPTPKGTDHTPLIMIPDMEDISADHSPTAIPTVTEAAVSEGTPHTPYPLHCTGNTAKKSTSNIQDLQPP